MKRFGQTDLQVSKLMFGGNVFGWTADKKTSFALLDAFVDSGMNFIDTANVYSRWVPGNHGGESETIIGEWMKERGSRSKIVLATKCGMDMGAGETGLSRSAIFKAVEASLRRLQTDRIDLYMAHRDDEGTPLEETMAAFDELVRAGKIRYAGASNYSAARLEKALQVSAKGGFTKYVSLEPQYNLYDRASFEKDLEPLCLRESLGVIPYYSLASGFLTGKYRSATDASKSPRGQAVAANYLNERGQKILKALDQVAEKNRCTPAQVSLAWLMQRPSVSAPIASATSVEQLGDLIKSTRLQLSADDVRLLDETRA